MVSLQKVRAFIAIVPEQAVIRNLRYAAAPIEASLDQRSVRWVANKNLHITLRFLGGLDSAQLARLTELLTKRMADRRCFTLTFDRICWFPSPRRPKIIAAMLQPSTELTALARRAELVAQAVGLTPQQNLFRPHLTLARYKGHGRAPQIPSLPITGGSMIVKELVLFRSDLHPEGTAYSPLARCALLPADNE